MIDAIQDSSPSFKARMAGGFWLGTIVTSGFAAFVGGKVTVASDAVATAANLFVHEALFRAGTAANLIATACYLVATLFIYKLFKPVNRNVALLGVFVSLVGCAVGAVGSIFEIIPYILLHGDRYLSVVPLEQLQALALMFLKVRAETNGLALIFFALHCLSVGYLVLRATFFPRAIGVLMLLAGLGWLTFLLPPLANSLVPYNLMPGGIGELSLSLWLLIKGVNVERWKQQDGAAVRIDAKDS